MIFNDLCNLVVNLDRDLPKIFRFTDATIFANDIFIFDAISKVFSFVAPPKQAPATDFGFGSGATSFSFDAKPKAPSTATAPTTAAPPKTSTSQPLAFSVPAPKQSTQQVRFANPLTNEHDSDSPLLQ